VTTEAKLLSALRREEGSALSSDELTAALGISSADLQTRLQTLRKLGYTIAPTPHHGLLLRAAPDVLHRDDLMSLAQNNHVIGRDIQVFGETTSTNDLADKLGRDGVAEGIVVFAESQTRGRGRLGRAWFSPAGKGLWFSVLLRPEMRPQTATQMTVAVATSTVRAIRAHTGIAPEIKWPNDVLVGGKKLAGVLTEMSAELDRIKYMVLGIGLDVNLSSNDLPAELRGVATSLLIETRQSWRRADLAGAILAELDRDYSRIRSDRFSELAEEWERYCSTLGQQVAINIGGRIVHGRAESLDDDGALLLRTEHGHLERIVGGDVTLAG
jgi:BirA family transcriptional regulator, biotin operon repressor / biotin---[acetyl-CoA-carboxylase] ligase